MKHMIQTVAALLVAGVACTTQAAEKPIAGPKGGKLLDNPAPRAEFFVEKDRMVTITFYGDDLKPVPVKDQSAVIWADAKSGRVKIPVEKKGGVLASIAPLPEGDGYNVVVQLKPTPDAKAQSFKIAFHDEQCSKCKRAEYACICEEAHDHKEGDGHKH